MSQDKAERYNQNKIEYSLLDFECLKPCAEVLAFGAKKYSRDNWKKGMPREEILDSLLRHIGALLNGQELDPESGITHIGHIQANAMFLANKNNTVLTKKKPRDHSMEEQIELERKAMLWDTLAIDVDSTAFVRHLEEPVSFEEYDEFVSAFHNNVDYRALSGLCPHPINNGEEKE